MESDESESDYNSDSDSGSPLNQQQPPPVKKWDQFREVPPSVDVGSAVKDLFWIRAERLVKVVAYIFSFFIVLLSAIASKGTILLMVRQISLKATNLAFCNTRDRGGQWIEDPVGKKLEVDFSCTTEEDPIECNKRRVIERVAWIWALCFAFAVPQVLSFTRSLRKCLFKFVSFPTLIHFTFVLTMELLHTAGLAILVFCVLPEMDSTAALYLTASFASVPSLLLLLSRLQEDNDRKFRVSCLLLVDIFAVIAQLSGALVWPLAQFLVPDSDTTHLVRHPYPWAIPVAVILVSCGWWETYAEEDSGTRLGKFLWNIKHRMIEKSGSRYVVYVLVAPLKILLFMGSMVGLTYWTGAVTKTSDLVDFFQQSFNTHDYVVREVDIQFVADREDFESGYLETSLWLLEDSTRHVLWVLLIQIFTSLLTYVTAKFASKVQIQQLGFALPISVVTPACVAILFSMCGARARDECVFHHDSFFIPNRIFFECPATGSMLELSWQSSIWIFIIWFVSYIWITLHIWYPMSPRLATTEQMFGRPFYEGLFIDQAVMMNRRRDGDKVLTTQQLEEAEEELEGFDRQEYTQYPDRASSPRSKSSIKNSDRVTKIYACATMWHESEEEMMEMLKSLFRIDSDYSARRLSQKYLGIVDPDYYEWETHVLFDDCMEVGGAEEEQVCNQFVLQLVDMMDEAGSRHFGKKIRVKPCKKYPTPYGGRLVWVLPGKTRIVCHLKDKSKIRHKKRWSQCMYMYYLLGYKLMELPISDERKEVMAENTFLLALDGDVDFQPEAVIRLVDLMKKNKGVGAACGRIHPTGSGFMPWYQKFEYAVGHWLQKATEHVLGCVLCSPGCFSLFRGKAIMDDNVMRKYTTVAKQAREYVQFDQGEDRWLCTLLLQRGWRVEYSAASDSFTACPEGFDEFYNQRRRWMPSTILNIWDLLQGWKGIVEVNEDISWLYMLYQMGIMVGTFIGPGGIYMAMAGGCTQVFGGDSMTWLIVNLVPLVVFCLACYYTDTKFQLALAKLMTLLYTMVMLAVYVGLLVQVIRKGWLSPTSISAGSFFLPLIIAGFLHLEEAYCMPYMVVYLITIPSMYILLVIYSFFNMWNVSWGTREVAQKKTKAEMEREKKEEEERLKEMKNKKKDGLMGTLLDQFNLGGDQGDTASVDFSLGNVLRCMCFTHDDPLEPKKQLVKISSSMDEMSKRLSRIEVGSGMTGGGGTSVRRKSSVKGNRRSMSSVPEGMEGEAVSEAVSEVVEEESDESEKEEEEQQKVQRNDDTNPYWIEDVGLKKGPVDYLPGGEINFWRDLIEKYLKPLEMTKKQKETEATALKDYRDVMIFTFLMINALYIVSVLMLQVQAEIRIPWTLFKEWDVKGQDGTFYNITYTEAEVSGLEAVVTVKSTVEELDMLGLIFLVTFSLITIAQTIGMFFHRWQTLCHYISSTELPLPWLTSGDEDTPGSSSEIMKTGLAITKQMQAPDTKDEKEANKSVLERRQTIAKLTSYHNQQGSKGGKELNLENEFRKRFQSMDLTNQEDPMIRRLSTRRGTLHALANRRNSYILGDQQRKKSVAFTNETKGSSFSTNRSSVVGQSFLNLGYQEQEDSDFEDDFTDFSSSHRASEIGGRNSGQFDISDSRL